MAPESWEWVKSSRVLGTRRKEYEMPTFLWIEKEEPRRNPERRVREGRKKAGKGNILKAKGREEFSSLLTATLYSPRPLYFSMWLTIHLAAQVSKQVSF